MNEPPFYFRLNQFILVRHIESHRSGIVVKQLRKFWGVQTGKHGIEKLRLLHVCNWEGIVFQGKPLMLLKVINLSPYHSLLVLYCFLFHL